MHWLGAIATLSLMLSACGPPVASTTGSDEPASSQAPVDLSDFHIKLERGLCFGTCPFYTVEVRGDGLAEYCGVQFVKERGRRSRTISQREIQPLIALLNAADFFNLKENYIAAIDSPIYVISASFGGRSHVVKESYGENMDMPRAVTQLQNAIDAAARTADWIGKTPEPGDPYPNANAEPIPDCLRDPVTVSYVIPDQPPAKH